MKNIIKLLTLSFVLLVLISCDPPQNIHFINKTDSESNIKIDLNSKVENYRLKQISTGDSIVFHLNPKDTANIFFGIGDWSDSEIEELTNSLNSIEIETEDIKTIYKTKQAMKNILSKNKHGIWFKHLIEIQIE